MSDIYGIAKSGLQAYKEGLATTGQNIANVGNEAYSRREAPISEVKSGSDALQISNTAGYGVKIDGITNLVVFELDIISLKIPFFFKYKKFGKNFLEKSFSERLSILKLSTKTEIILFEAMKNTF